MSQTSTSPSSAATAFDPIRDAALFLLAPSFGPIASDEAINLAASYDAKTLVLAFETGADVTTRQVIYEQGATARGMTAYIEDGALHLGVFDMSDWGWRSVSTPVTAGARHTAALVLDGTAGVLTGHLDGTVFGAVDGAGPLDRHTGGAGVGQVHDKITLDDAVVNDGAEFKGDIGLIAQYNHVADAADVTAVLNAAGIAPPPPTFDPVRDAALFLLAPSFGPIASDEAINLAASYDAKTLVLAFETGADVTTRQMIYEQGATVRGMTAYIENGALHLGVFDMSDWGWRGVSTPVTAGARHTAALVLDGTAGVLTGHLDGTVFGAVDGAGPLDRHTGGAGVGQVNENITLDGVLVGDTAEFKGDIGFIAQYNHVADAADVTAVLDAAGIAHAPAAPADEGDTPVVVDPTPVLVPTLVGDVEATAGVATKIASDALDPIWATAHEVFAAANGVRATVTRDPDGALSVLLPDPNTQGDILLDLRAVDAAGAVIATGPLRISATPNSHAHGWGEGDHYTLAVDADGWSVVEPGQKHRVFHVSPDGAADADGLTPETAMSVEAGMAAWTAALDPDRKAPSSHWLLLEAGHSYDIDRLVPRGAQGEAPLHPLLIGAYGDGARPVIETRQFIFQEQTQNLVIRDIDFSDKVTVLTPDMTNILFENVLMHDEFVVQGDIEALTLRRSAILDVSVDTPVGGAWDYTGGHANRVSGLYANGVDGLLIEETVFDHNGWVDGYESDPDAQPPSIFSHNVYVNFDASDLTFRDNVSSRAASQGAQFRSGGFIEGNAFIDNNVGMTVLGGAKTDYDPFSQQAPRNASLLLDNIVTQAGYRSYVGASGALAWGVQTPHGGAVMHDNAVIHKFDPNNYEEIAQNAFRGGATATATGDPYQNIFDDTLVFNWNSGNTSNNTVSAGWFDPNLYAVTVQNLAKEMLGQDVTLDGFLDWMRVRDKSDWDDRAGAETVVDYFQKHLQLIDGDAPRPQDFVFVASDLGASTRWDNRLNWTTGDGSGSGPGGRAAADDVAGDVAGDRVDLGGNLVHYSGTRQLDALTLGAGARLEVSQGRLDVVGAFDGGLDAVVSVSRSGQFWFDGYASQDPVALSIEEGRIVNGGSVQGGVSVDASGGETLLSMGDAFAFDTDASLTIRDDDAKIGVAAGGRVRFEDGSALRFVAGDGGVSTLREIGDVASAASTMTIEGDASLSIDVSAMRLSGARETMMLVDVDQLTGQFAAHAVTGLELTGAAGARLRYLAETGDMTLELLAPGMGVDGLLVDLPL